jgi:hypothetical protein
MLRVDSAIIELLAEEVVEFTEGGEAFVNGGGSIREIGKIAEYLNVINETSFLFSFLPPAPSPRKRT